MARLRSKAKKSLPAMLEKDWQAEADMRVLRDAEKVRGDATRLKKAEDFAKSELADLARIIKDNG